ncbi:glucose-6-phosphate isomerase family protein [Fimbriimonas ginsengisoli]|uniref:glucose-6-phosphate isomerase n=1 Tax=Fimbriimonas ginsengisoli Gsoil 348 TaxID=661478 RepID=A0A068NSX3_FIMGI|nr:glucose-6-phosphate isomerase family protein [Fimbriimonas ginsengisoli]AIE85875.1 Glucose-6-phosphate isomerase-like protein [Fimbriimonas ginsengisoli Gsoil 348]
MPIFTDLASGLLRGEQVAETRRTVGDLAGYWADETAAQACADELLYTTQTWFPIEDGTEGAVLWGNTTLMPGRVGEERFMTRGHWHVKRDRGELVVTVSGKGLLVLMDEDRNATSEELTPGSTHWIDGRYAHRTVNTGDEPLVFLCAWPADCGHEYDAILSDGFSMKVT